MSSKFKDREEEDLETGLDVQRAGKPPNPVSLPTAEIGTLLV